MSSDATNEETNINQYPPRTLLQCGACGEDDPPKTCSACKLEFYCDTTCQKEHRKAHRPFCNKVKNQRLEHEQEIEKAKQMLQDKEQRIVTDCAVCLEENDKNSASFVRLDCGHFFCYGCVIKCQLESLKSMNVGRCPLCRQSMPIMNKLLVCRHRLFMLLAKNSATEEERDEICNVAVEELESVLKQYPGLAAAWELLGETCMVMERYGNAIQSYTKSYHTRVLSEDARRLGSVDEIHNAMERAPTDESIDIDALCSASFDVHSIVPFAVNESILWHSKIFVHLSKAYIQNGELQNATKLLSVVDQLIKEHSWIANTYNAYEFAVAKAECCYFLGNYNEALQVIEDYLDPTLTHHGLRLVRSRCLMELGQFQDAKRIAGLLYYRTPPWVVETKQECLALWQDITARESGE